MGGQSAQVTRQLSRSDVLPPPLAPPTGVHSSFLSAGVSKISYHKEKQKQVLLNVELCHLQQLNATYCSDVTRNGGKTSLSLVIL